MIVKQVIKFLLTTYIIALATPQIRAAAPIEVDLHDITYRINLIDVTATVYTTTTKDITTANIAESVEY